MSALKINLSSKINLRKLSDLRPRRKTSAPQVSPIIYPDPLKVYATSLWIGTGVAQKITNEIDLSSGSLVIAKNRSSAVSPVVFDSVRGVNTYWLTTSTGAASTTAQTLTAYDSDGFEVGTNATLNGTGSSFVAWCFKESPRFLDIITYTGDGTNLRAIPHNLGITPGVVIVKRRDSAGSAAISHKDSNPGHQYQLLPDGNPPTVNDTTFGGVAPDKDNFYVGNSIIMNASGGSYVAYVFAHDPDPNGVIKCGSYIGNGSTSGPVIDLGWKPRFLLIYRASATGTGNKCIFDTARGINVGNDPIVFTSSTSAEDVTADRLELVSNGFQIKSSSTTLNNSGDQYVYMAVR